MGKTVIRESCFPEIVDVYNTQGKRAAYALIGEKYGLKQARHLIRRIIDTGNYTYDSESDKIMPVAQNIEGEAVFIGLDDLCAEADKKANDTQPPDPRPIAMEKLIHELISDRLLALSKYINLDTSTRTIFIDNTSLSADGYHVVTH